MENGSLELASSYGVSAGMGAGAGVFMIIWLALIVFFIYCGWKIFTKAGKPGWASLVPIYNIVVLLEITGKPIWWILLFLIPGVNLIMQIIVINELSQRFGKGSKIFENLLVKALVLQ